MRLSQYWHDVLGSASATDETCGSILNSLKTLDQAVGNTEQESCSSRGAKTQMRGLLSSLLLLTALERQGGAGEDSYMLIDTQRRLVPT